MTALTEVDLVRVLDEVAADLAAADVLDDKLDMDATEVTGFLSWLASDQKVSALTQNQALAAIAFLYRFVLHRELPWLEHVVRAKRPLSIPVVLRREEVATVLAELAGVPKMIALLRIWCGPALARARPPESTPRAAA